MGCTQSNQVPSTSAGPTSVSDVKVAVEEKQQHFQDVYKLQDELGKGAFSTVYRAVHKRTGQKYAVKVVKKEGLPKEDEVALQLEVEILQGMDHPHIIRLYQFFDEQKHYYLVTELMEGGELFDRIVQKTFYNEKEARDLVFILLSAVKFLHDRNIVHRDLKPENVLLTSRKDDAEIKLADFGFAERVTSMNSLTTQCGTPGYVAPEILKSEAYGKPVDMWSIGVITYILLGGYPPFHDENQRNLFSKIKRGKYEFHDEYWSAVSEEAKDLISKMLKVNPLERLTAEEALKHPWVMASPEELAKRDLAGTLSEIRKFNARRKFRGVAKALVAAARMRRLIGAPAMSAAQTPTTEGTTAAEGATAPDGTTAALVETTTSGAEGAVEEKNNA